jgi:glutaredoxin-like YruB-family protein
MPNIKVFSTSTCSYCIRAKEYLKSRGVDFQNVDVATDKAGLDEMMRVSGQMGVPVIIIDGEVIVGFDRDRIETKLGPAHA